MGKLRMIYVADEKRPLPEVTLPAGFALRVMGRDEMAAYNDLRVSAGFAAWDEAVWEQETRPQISGGHLVVVETATGRLAASATAELPVPEHFHGFGLLGWVMCHPDFRGQRLGYAVCAAVMRMLHAYGYRTFILATDDFRVPAVKTYLNLGWQPWLTEPEMEELWHHLADVYKCSYESFRALPADYKPPRNVTLHPFD